MSKNLIIYYSRKGENYWSGGIKSIEKGNTETVAELAKNFIELGYYFLKDSEEG